MNIREPNIPLHAAGSLRSRIRDCSLLPKAFKTPCIITHLRRRRIAGSSPQMPVLGQLFVTMHELLPRESSRMHAHSSNLLAKRETEAVNTYVPLALSCCHSFVTLWQHCQMPALSGYLKCTVKRRESENRARSRALLSGLKQLREMC